MALDLDTNDHGDLMVTSVSGTLIAQFPMEEVWDMLQDDPVWSELLQEYVASVDQNTSSVDPLSTLARGRKNRVKLLKNKG